MNKHVKKDLTVSSKRFEEIVKPKLRELLKGDFLLVEGETTDKMKKCLDVLAGIDSWHIDKLRGIRGIASRIQTIDLNKYKPFNTFTIRNKRESGASTEYEKRKYAIENDYLYPFFTVQAYVNKLNNKLLSCSIAKTKDIIDYIDRYNPSTKNTGKEQKGQAEFWVVHWDKFRNSGYKIYILQ